MSPPWASRGTMSAGSYGFRHGTSLIIRPLKLSLDTLHRHLSGAPVAAYLVSGDEALLVGEAADAIRAAAKRAGYLEREVFFIERVADWDAVRASTNNLSLFGSRKLIELRLPSGKPGVGGANAIVELLAGAGPDNVYLMLTGKLEREQSGSAWVKAFENTGAWLPVWPIELERLPQWLSARAAQPRTQARRCGACSSSSNAPRETCWPRNRSSKNSSSRWRRERRISPRCRPRSATARDSTCFSSAKLRWPAT